MKGSLMLLQQLCTAPPAVEAVRLAIALWLGRPTVVLSQLGV
jgi:hypothetical protein